MTVFFLGFRGNTLFNLQQYYCQTIDMEVPYPTCGCGIWQEADLIEFESSGLPEHRPAVEDCHPQHAGFVYS
jgi:hypothetical protein